MRIADAEMKQNEFYLSDYTSKAQKKIEAKNNILDNAKNFYQGRKNIIEGFKKEIFPLKHNDKFEEDQQTSKKFNEKEPLKKPTKIDVNKFSIKREKDINKELFKNYFNFQRPTELLKTLYNLNDKKKKSLIDTI